MSCPSVLITPRRSLRTANFRRIRDHVSVVVRIDVRSRGVEVLVPEISNRRAARAADIRAGNHHANTAKLWNALLGLEMPNPGVRRNVLTARHLYVGRL